MPRTEPNISKEVLWEKLEYTPHSEGQRKAHESDARFRAVCCGRRWGKSQWGGHEMTAKMFVPDSINWIVGPTYILGEKEFRVTLNDFKKLGLIAHTKFQYNIEQGRMRIYWPQINSLCEVKSATRPDSLVGEGVDHIVMSEAAKHNRSTWEMYLRPALADKVGSADFPSTPQGYNWYKGLYDLGQSPDHAEYDSFKFPSWTNPIVFPGGRTDPEVLTIEQSTSEMFFNQEIGADFTSFEGMIYPEYNQDVHVKTFDAQSMFASCRSYLALDFGYVDPFVALDILVDTQQRVWVWREYMESYKSTYDHGQIIKNRSNPKDYRIDCIYADPRGADEIATLSWLLGGIQAHAVGWSLGVEAIKRAFAERSDGTYGLYIHPSCRELIRQLQNLRAKTTKEGHNTKEGQHDYDDHGPDALRYFFNEYFVLGGGETLSDFYGNPQRSEAHSFFTYEGNITMGESLIKL